MGAKSATAKRLAELGRIAFPGDAARRMLSFQANLEASQWWPPAKIARFQEAQLATLLAHAHRFVPYYRRLMDEAGLLPGRPIDWARWRGLPVLTRDELQSRGDALRATRLPEHHTELGWIRSSGSTGRAVAVLGSNVHDLWQKTLTLRTQIWAGRDVARTMGVIRKLASPRPPDGDRLDAWGDADSFPFPTGPCVRLSATAELSDQAAWLERQRPGYLTTYPSILRALAAALPGDDAPVRGGSVSTLGESVDRELRDLVARQWGCRIFDAYSAEEVGCVAIECPDGGGYHIQAEAALVEVLDADSRPCRPGEIGRIVVTPLHNYAMPLLRYALGDYAQAGRRCRCGRGLPVLKRILGRERNMLVLADGRSYWPSFRTRALARIAPIQQQQFHQPTPDRLEARLVVSAPLSAEQEAAVREHIQDALPAPLDVALVYVDAIPRNPGGKFELFTSAVAPPHARRSATTSA